MVSVAGGSGPGLDCAPLPPQPACCAVCLRRHCLAAAMCPAASVQPPAAPHYVLCQAPSYSMLLTDLPAVTISGFEASHNGRNIWVKIWYMLIFNFDFSCFYPLCFKLGQSLLIYVCIWNLIFSTLLKRAVKSKVHILKNRFYSFFKILILIFTGDEK